MLRRPLVLVPVTLVTLVATLTGLASCVAELGGGDDVDVATDGDDSDDLAPLIGVNGAGDYADRSCQIHLADVGRVVADSGAGFATRGSRWIFEGRVDVSKDALAEGAVPMILWKAGSDRTWRAIAPYASTGISGETDRFIFQVSDGNLPGPGLSTTALSRSTIQMIPYLQQDRVRLFDHNRIDDALATYVMNVGNGFHVAEDAAVCGEAAGPTLSFHADFTESQTGPVVGGRSVTIDYDIARLPECRQTYSGAPSWSVLAHATFLPMNVRQEVLVVNHATSPSSSLPVQLQAPKGATGLVLWFQNNDRAGCHRYDSDFGADYHFAVADAPPPEAGPEWMGNVTATISRGSSRRCGEPQAFGSQLSFGTWARQRAAITDLCFEVFEPGVTDFRNPDLWQQLDVQVHHRADPAKPFVVDPVSLADLVGNNARYAVDLRALDPFQWGRCLNDVAVSAPTGNPGDEHVQATVEMFLTVNGAELRPDLSSTSSPSSSSSSGGGATFKVVYDDYANAGRVSCP